MYERSGALLVKTLVARAPRRLTSGVTEPTYAKPGQVPRTCLVCMPWQELSRPSLSLGVLRGVCAADGLPVPLTYQGGLRFAEFLLERSDGRLTPYDYTTVADTGFMYLFGDWVFSGALHDPEFGYEPMAEYAARKVSRCRR